MKVEAEKLNAKPKFEPFEITITVESEKEMNAIYSIFNHGSLHYWFYREAGFSLDNITYDIRRMYGGCPDYGEIFNRMLEALEPIEGES